MSTIYKGSLSSTINVERMTITAGLQEDYIMVDIPVWGEVYEEGGKWWVEDVEGVDDADERALAEEALIDAAQYRDEQATNHD